LTRSPPACPHPVFPGRPPPPAPPPAAPAGSVAAATAALAVLAGLSAASSQSAPAPAPENAPAAWRVECSGDGKMLECRALQQVFHRETRQLLVSLQLRPAADRQSGAMIVPLPL